MRWAPLLWLLAGLALLVGWVLTRLQGLCLDAWGELGGSAPPCWLPFGS
jgi:hypothetical protein